MRQTFSQRQHNFTAASPSVQDDQWLSASQSHVGNGKIFVFKNLLGHLIRFNTIYCALSDRKIMKSSQFIRRSLCKTILLPNICGSEVVQALILNKIPGFAKPSRRQNGLSCKIYNGFYRYNDQSKKIICKDWSVFGSFQ